MLAIITFLWTYMVISSPIKIIQFKVALVSFTNSKLSSLPWSVTYDYMVVFDGLRSFLEMGLIILFLYEVNL